MLPGFRRRDARGALVVASLALAGCGREPAQRADSAADSTRAVRTHIVALEAARTFGDGFLPRACLHPDARVRRAAAVALGRIQDASVLPALLPLLADADTSVASQAAFAIGQLQGVDEAGRHALQRALLERIDRLPRHEVAPYVEAVGKQGGPEVVDSISSLLATGILASAGSEARPALVEGLTALALARIDTHRRVWHLSQVGDLRNREVGAAWRFGAAFAAAPDTAYTASLTSLLQHPHRFARAQGARAVAKLGDAALMPQLTAVLADLDWEVRASALLAIAELADRVRPDRDAAGFCAALVGDRHPLVREAALAALDSFGVRPHEAFVREALQDPVPAVRLCALRTLAPIDRTALHPAWDAARSDSVDFVRAEALPLAHHVLGLPEALRLWIEVLEGPVPRERAQAARALGAHGRGREAARAALEAALGDSDFVVAATAAEALGRLRARESFPALSTTYSTRRARHEDVDVRLAAVTAVADLVGRGGKLTGAAAFFESAGADADLRVAHAARIGLARLAGNGDPVLPPAHAAESPAVLETQPIDLGRVRVRLVTRHGTAILELEGDRFPRTVGNFLTLVDRGFYADGVFHRVVPAFVVQGGCPRGDGWGDAGRYVPCEYGDLRYADAGVVGMAHAGRDTGGSQFFITHVPVARLDGRYTAFGRVVEGLDVVNRIVRGDRFQVERLPGDSASR